MSQLLRRGRRAVKTAFEDISKKRSEGQREQVRDADAGVNGVLILTEVDVLQGLDLLLLDEPAELGHRDPDLVVVAATATATATATTTVATAAASTVATTTTVATAVRVVKRETGARGMELEWQRQFTWRVHRSNVPLPTATGLRSIEAHAGTKRFYGKVRYAVNAIGKGGGGRGEGDGGRGMGKGMKNGVLRS